MNMRSIKNRLLLKGRKNKKTIITILLAIVALAGIHGNQDTHLCHSPL